MTTIMYNNHQRLVPSGSMNMDIRNPQQYGYNKTQEATDQTHVKQERHDEAEINELANKLRADHKAAIQKAAAIQLQQQTNAANRANANMANANASGQTNIYNYFGRRATTGGQPNNVSVAEVIKSMASSTDNGSTGNDTAESRPNDESSVMGKFKWTTIGKANIPVIIRSDEEYCSVRMVEYRLIGRYLNYLSSDIFSCTSIGSYYITEAESRLFNEINIKHCDHFYGKEQYTQKDLIVRLRDAIEFFYFLDFCYKKLDGSKEMSLSTNDKCGFIRINNDAVVPYTMRENQKYVPLFYFEGETDNLKKKALSLSGWDLAYLKFCCKVQGIRNELFASDSVLVISLTDIKKYFPAGTEFEHYWPKPSEPQNLLLLGNRMSSNANQVHWTNQPAAPPPPPNLMGTAEVKPIQSQTQPARRSSSTVSYPQSAGVNNVIQSVSSNRNRHTTNNSTLPSPSSRSGYCNTVQNPPNGWPNIANMPQISPQPGIDQLHSLTNGYGAWPLGAHQGQSQMEQSVRKAASVIAQAPSSHQQSQRNYQSNHRPQPQSLYKQSVNNRYNPYPTSSSSAGALNSHLPPPLVRSQVAGPSSMSSCVGETGIIRSTNGQMLYKKPNNNNDKMTQYLDNIIYPTTPMSITTSIPISSPARASPKINNNLMKSTSSYYPQPKTTNAASILGLDQLLFEEMARNHPLFKDNYLNQSRSTFSNLLNSVNSLNENNQPINSILSNLPSSTSISITPSLSNSLGPNAIDTINAVNNSRSKHILPPPVSTSNNSSMDVIDLSSTRRSAIAAAGASTMPIQMAQGLTSQQMQQIMQFHHQGQRVMPSTSSSLANQRASINHHLSNSLIGCGTDRMSRPNDFGMDHNRLANYKLAQVVIDNVAIPCCLSTKSRDIEEGLITLRDLHSCYFNKYSYDTFRDVVELLKLTTYWYDIEQDNILKSLTLGDNSMSFMMVRDARNNLTAIRYSLSNNQLLNNMYKKQRIS